MLIVCPACASAYEIEAARVGPEGRSVRCAACRETWFIGPDDPAAAALLAPEGTDLAPEPPVTEPDPGHAGPAEADVAPPVTVETTTVPPRARPGPRPRRRPRISPALAAALVLLACLPPALLGRSTVVRAMPQTAGLYARVGLPVNLRGLEFRDVVAFQTAPEGSAPARLVVEGDLVGLAREGAAVPPIVVEVRGDRDQPLYRWTVPPPRTVLGRAESARFRASLSAPPAGARAIEVRFAAPDAPRGGASDGEPSREEAPAGARGAAAIAGGAIEH